MPINWLPPLLTLTGNETTDVPLLYSRFNSDFKISKPVFRKNRVFHDNNPAPGPPPVYEEIFRHLITRDDSTTGQRVYNTDRAARLPWCASLINNFNASEVLAWDYRESDGEIRSYIWADAANYAVVLDNRRKSKPDGTTSIRYILRTAFVVDTAWKRLELQTKYSARI